ncbi:superantigen-like protein SSL4 [Actinoplanes awajinensis]|uniref:PPE family domain-containing protein n=1 Tax=Actinoplanes awajinensis subsp. mycoplanecinus TaxID=135947 RepID=A0A101J9G9_9ACTN|nr:hypothetical protein [Actinoplanes awajinensis]KUL22654.1 hypothetical protein ADL15_47725 [Actinoplanes awajinensis subsp. mycoplanecinus]
MAKQYDRKDWEESGGGWWSPTTVDATDLNDYQGWARTSGGWAMLRASITGAAGIATPEQIARAATLVNAQSVMDAYAAFQRALSTLLWLETFVHDQSKAIAGEGRGWQGTAANAFLTKMEGLSKSIGKQAEHISGAAGIGSINSVPSQLNASAQYLQWGQKTMAYLDESFAALSREANNAVGSNGLVSITGSPFEKPMTEAMLKVVDTVATQYEATTSAVNANTGSNAPVNTPTPSPSTPNVSTPNVSTPNISTPNISTPNISTPNISTPNISTPNVSTPNISTPNISTPNISTPNISTPNISTPNVSTPNISTPNISTPNISTPNISTPNISTPSFSTPTTGLPGFDTPTGTGIGGGSGGSGLTGGGVPTFTAPQLPKPPGTSGGTGIGGGAGSSGGIGSGTGVGAFTPPKVPSAPTANTSGGTGIGGGIDIPGLTGPGVGGGSGGGVGAGMPGGGMPGGGAGGGAGGVSLPDAPDSHGLLTGDESDWKPTTIGSVDVPDAPGGANPGGSGLGGMPGGGMPGGGAGGGAGGVSLPDAPDAGGLLTGDEADWQAPTLGSVDVPDAPGGANPGGSGLVVRTPVAAVWVRCPAVRCPAVVRPVVPVA